MNIKINSFQPGGLGVYQFTITCDSIEYDVAYELIQPIASDFSYSVDDAPVQLLDSSRDTILERLALFLTFFDFQDMDAHIRELTEQALKAMEDHLERNAAAPPTLHAAVQITAPQWGQYGIVTGVGFANGVYEVTYWAGNSGAPLVHTFRGSDLRILS